jgi:hypothetical protein
MTKLLAPLAAALLCAGCATADTEGSNSLHSTARVRNMHYLTGSRVPLRHDGNAQGTKVTEPDDMQRQDMQINNRQVNPSGR